jgi:hypothetical protein
MFLAEEEELASDIQAQRRNFTFPEMPLQW